jgi:hypothetical protein
MRKQMVKKLFTLYSVKGDLDIIRKDPNHNFISYCDGEAECIKYHDDFIDWIIEVTSNNFENGFGIKLLTEDGEDYVDIHEIGFSCSKFYCKTHNRSDILHKFTNIIRW